MKTGTYNRRKRQRGAGMVEVLVAVLVLAIGMLGYAGLQTRAMRATGDAYLRAQAMGIAQDLAERMRLNRAGATTYSASSNWPLTALTETEATTHPNTCLSADCTAVQMATYDIADIRYNAAALLPDGRVSMGACLTSTLMSCIYVAWDGTKPSAGSTGECVNATGKLVSNPNCAMLEVR